MKKHILNVVILTLLLVCVSSICSIVFPQITTLYDEPPTNKIERTEYMRELIDVIHDGIECRYKKIDIRAFNCDEDTLKEVMTLASFNNPLHSLYINNYRVVFSITGRVNYIMLDYTAENKVNYVATEITSIINTMGEGLSDLDKVIWINNYICSNYEYDYSNSWSDAFEMLSSKKGACGAYTQMFTLLAEEAGLCSSFAASFQMNHVWNVVQVDGCWYNIDVTWNDDTYICCYLSSDAAMLSFHSHMRSTEDTIQFVICDDTKYDMVQLAEQ